MNARSKITRQVNGASEQMLKYKNAKFIRVGFFLPNGLNANANASVL